MPVTPDCPPSAHGPRRGKDDCISLNVSGETFTIPLSLLAQLQSLPWCTYRNGMFYLNADPKTFRWLLHYKLYKTLPNALDAAELEAIHSISCILGMHDVVQSLQKENEFITPNKKRRPSIASMVGGSGIKRAKTCVRANSERLLRKKASWSASKNKKTPCHELVMGSSPAVI